jgi:hypothetical protein
MAGLHPTLTLRVYAKETNKAKYASYPAASFVPPVYQKSMRQYS